MITSFSWTSESHKRDASVGWIRMNSKKKKQFFGQVIFPFHEQQLWGKFP